MAGKSLLLVWATLVCGRVLVHGRPQVYNKPSSPSSSQPQIQERSSPEPPDSPYPVAVGTTKAVEISHGYSFNSAANRNGEPYTSGYAYVKGAAGNGPTYLADTNGYLGSELWSARSIDLATTGLYMTAGLLALGSLYYIGSPLLPGGGSARKSTKGSGSKGNKDKDKEKDKETSADEKEEKESGKSRRRRDAQVVTQADADLTRLASIVLNAIASGECLQKTVCQIGSQVGESPKGRLAFSLIDTLLPPSVHTNQYFITMKKSLKGESQCERFNCKHSF